jgi:hypothetical protein
MRLLRTRVILTLTASLCAACGSCGNYPIYEAQATGNTGKNAAMSLSIPVPANTVGNANGDLLIAFAAVKINPELIGPSGWTVIPQINGFNTAICGSDDLGIACNLTAYYKIADGSETSVAFSWPKEGSPRQAAGAVLRYSRIDTTSPIGAIARQAGSSNAPTAPDVTTTRSESRVLRIGVSEADNVRNSLTDTILSGDPAMSRLNILSFPAASVSLATGCGPPLSGCSYTNEAVGLAISDNGQKDVGPAGTASWSLPGTDQWLGVTLEIKKPGSTPVITMTLPRSHQ